MPPKIKTTIAKDEINDVIGIKISFQLELRSICYILFKKSSMIAKN